jgi:hypothetical protein
MTITINDIFKEVQKYSKNCLKSKLKNSHQANLRFIYYELSRILTDESQTNIANLTEKARSGITHASKEVHNVLNSEPLYAEIYESIYNKLKLVENIHVPTQKSQPKEKLTQYEIHVLSALKNMSDIDISLFIDSRLKPYVNMLKSKTTQQVKVVAGAIRNRTSNLYDL